MSYDAFISYSHSADDRIAPALQRGLHRFAKPLWQRRAVHVFRDETNLTVDPDLFGKITDTLDQASHFILLASPAAAQSKWVAREVAHWLDHRDAERLLIVVTDGDVEWDDAAADFDWTRTTALPEVLRGAFEREPLFLDLRWTREAQWADGEQDFSRDPRFLDCVARLSARLRGMSLDEISGEDVRQHRRTRRIAAAAVALIVAGAAAAGVGAWFAYRGQQEAERNLEEAVGTMDVFIYSVFEGAGEAVRLSPQKMRHLATRLKGILGRFEQRHSSERLRHRQAVVLVMLARSFLSGSSQSFAPEAEPPAARAVTILTSLVKANPGKPYWRRDLAMALGLLGDARFTQGRIGAAHRNFETSLHHRQVLAKSQPGNLLFQYDLAIGLQKMARSLRLAGRPRTAERMLLRGRNICRKLIVRLAAAPAYAALKPRLKGYLEKVEEDLELVRELINKPAGRTE